MRWAVSHPKRFYTRGSHYVSQPSSKLYGKGTQMKQAESSGLFVHWDLTTAIHFTVGALRLWGSQLCKPWSRLTAPQSSTSQRCDTVTTTPADFLVLLQAAAPLWLSFSIYKEAVMLLTSFDLLVEKQPQHTVDMHRLPRAVCEPQRVVLKRSRSATLWGNGAFLGLSTVNTAEMMYKRRRSTGKKLNSERFFTEDNILELFNTNVSPKQNYETLEYVPHLTRLGILCEMPFTTSTVLSRANPKAAWATRRHKFKDAVNTVSTFPAHQAQNPSSLPTVIHTSTNSSTAQCRNRFYTEARVTAQSMRLY